MALFGRKKNEPEEQIGTFATPEDLIAALRAYVMPPEKLSAGTAEGAPEVLPGLVMAVALRMGDQVNFLPYTTMVDLGGAEGIWPLATGNLKNLDGVDVIRETVVEGRTDTDIVTLWADDPFVASRCTVLDWLAEELFGVPVGHGVLVCVPARERLMLHVLSGVGVLHVVKTFAIAGYHLHWDAPVGSRVSPDVFLVVPGGQAWRVGYMKDAQEVVVDTTGVFGQILYGPPPAGFGTEP
jgi:hypothetical protein